VTAANNAERELTAGFQQREIEGIFAVQGSEMLR